MKIECVKEKLERAISYSEKVTAKNPSLPVLKCIHIEAKKNGIVLKATNLDVGVEIEVSAKVSEEGVVAVPGSLILSVLSQIQNEKTVTLYTEDNNLIIKTESTSSTIKTQPAEDFPVIPKFEAESELIISPQEFSKGVKSVWYSASNSSIKPELASIYIYPEENNIVFVATDLFRLAEKKIKTKKTLDFKPFLLPHKNIIEVLRVIEDFEGDIEIGISANQVYFKGGNIYIVSRIVDGVFPDYKRIIPTQSTTDIILLRQDLVNSLKLSTIFSNKFNQLTFLVDPKQKLCEVTTKNSDIGENVFKLAATISGDSITITVNLKHIVESLQSIAGDSVNISFNRIVHAEGNNEDKPIIVKDNSDKNFTYLMMPMNK